MEVTPPFQNQAHVQCCACVQISFLHFYFFCQWLCILGYSKLHAIEKLLHVHENSSTPPSRMNLDIDYRHIHVVRSPQTVPLLVLIKEWGRYQKDAYSRTDIIFLILRGIQPLASFQHGLVSIIQNTCKPFTR